MSIASSIRQFLGSARNREWVRTRNVVYSAERRCVRCSGLDDMWGPFSVGVNGVGPVSLNLCRGCAYDITARDLIVITAAMLAEHRDRTEGTL